VRVGLLIYGSLDALSGGYLYDRKLAAHLEDQGDQVEVISLPWRNYPRHLLDNLSKALFDRLSRLPVDVLIQDELNHPSAAWLNHRLESAYPIISLVHHLRCEEVRPDWQNILYRRVERRYLESVDGFIFNSQTTRQSVERVSRTGSRPWVIAPPAGDRLDPQIEIEEINGRAHQPGPLRLVFLGNLIPRKGLHTLIEAVARLPSHEYRLDVVGDTRIDPLYSRLIRRQIRRLIRRQTKRYGLGPKIRFLGSQDDASLADTLRANHVLVVPSSYEGFGIVYLEGMGFGLPAIGTTQGAARELIRHGKNGYLIDPDDPESLSILLKNLYTDRQTLANLSLAAREQYNQFPGWEQSMAKARSFLLEMAGKAR
jgi:glycosyltransferase involved in cell wall biosynthesis